MTADEEARAQLHATIREMLETGPPETRVRAFALCISREVKALITEEGVEPALAMGMLLMTVIHTCDRHPEWLKAVVADSQWLNHPDDAETREEALLEICGLYPLPSVRADVPRD